MERSRRKGEIYLKKSKLSKTQLKKTLSPSLEDLPLSPNRKTIMVRRSHKSRTSKLVCALLFAASLVAAGRGGAVVVSAQSLPTFPGEGGQSAASAASSSAAFAADNAARSATLLAQNPSGPCSVALAQNAAFAASSAAAAAAAAGKFCLKREEIDDERKEQD